MVKSLFSNKIHLFLIIICATNFLMRIHHANMPAYGDELVYFRGVISIANNNLNPFTEFWGYKPPFMYLLPAFMFHFFQPSLLWGRIEIYLLSSLSLYFTFKIGKQLFNEEVGLAATVLLFFYPIFFAQSFLFMDAIPFTALFTGTVYFFLTNKFSIYALFGSLLVMTKEIGLLTVIMLPLYKFVRQKIKTDNYKPINRISGVYLIIPLFVFVIWLISNKLLFGWFLWPINTSLYNLDVFIKPEYDHRDWAIHQALNYNFEYIFVYIVAIGIFLQTILKKFRTNVLNHYFLLLLMFLYFLVLLGFPFHSRYFLFLLPILFTLSMTILARFFTSRFIIFFSLLFSIVFLIINVQFTTIPKGRDPELSIALFPAIQIKKDVINYIKNKYSNSTIIASSLLSDQISVPFWGYTKTIESNTIAYECPLLNNSSFFNELNTQINSSIHTVFLSDPWYDPCPKINEHTIIDNFCTGPGIHYLDCIKIYEGSLE